MHFARAVDCEGIVVAAVRDDRVAARRLTCTLGWVEKCSTGR